MPYLKNTHETPNGLTAYFYELTNSDNLVRAFRQDHTGIVQIQVTNTYKKQFQRCRQDLNLQTISQAEFSTLIYSPFGG